MKAPTPIPKNIRIIDREAFLASVEKRGHLLLRAKTENPNNHLLVIYSDPEEKYAVIAETGPNAEYTDLRQAARGTPPGLAIRYIVPCAQCPPYAIPKGLAQTGLPASLAPLSAPPADFTSTEEAVVVVEQEPEPAPAPSISARVSRPASFPPPAKVTRSPIVTPAPTVPSSPPSVSLGALPTDAASAAAGSGTLAALLARSLQDIEKSLAERDADLRRREAAVAAREGEFSGKDQKLESERRVLEEEAARINADFDAREAGLSRREAELQARVEGLVRSMRELEDLRRRIESVIGKDSVR